MAQPSKPAATKNNAPTPNGSTAKPSLKWPSWAKENLPDRFYLQQLDQVELVMPDGSHQKLTPETLTIIGARQPKAK